MFITIQTALERAKEKERSWDHWQLDVTKVNWNNRVFCVYILNGPLVLAVGGSGQMGKLASTALDAGLFGKARGSDCYSTLCNEQVMLTHKLLKSVIIINLSPPLHHNLISSSVISSSVVYISEETSGNLLFRTGVNEFYWLTHSLELGLSNYCCFTSLNRLWALQIATRPLAH